MVLGERISFNDLMNYQFVFTTASTYTIAAQPVLILLSSEQNVQECDATAVEQNS